MTHKTINRIIFVLSIAGLIMGVYVLQSFLRQSGIICLTGSGCEVVRKSPSAWPFGIPVPAIGVVGYTLLTILSFLRTTSANRSLLYAMLGMALFGVVFVTWFTYMELAIIKGVCMWCAISSVNMYVICGLVIKSLMRKERA